MLRKLQISNYLPNRIFSENCRWVPLMLSQLGTEIQSQIVKVSDKNRSQPKSHIGKPFTMREWKCKTNERCQGMCKRKLSAMFVCFETYTWLLSTDERNADGTLMQFVLIERYVIISSIMRRSDSSENPNNKYKYCTLPQSQKRKSFFFQIVKFQVQQLKVWSRLTAGCFAFTFRSW